MCCVFMKLAADSCEGVPATEGHYFHSVFVRHWQISHVKAALSRISAGIFEAAFCKFPSLGILEIAAVVQKTDRQA